MAWKTVLFGRPLRSDEWQHEQVKEGAGFALLAPDAISSVAYGTEEILIVLAPLGVAALWYSLPISLIIVMLLLFLVISYRQVIRDYPNGGGAYVVGKETLGTLPSLFAGASLLVDYTVTVSVSVTAGVAALVAAFPGLAPDRVELSIAAILIMTLINLRGIHEAANVFAPPFYLFIGLVLLIALVGLFSAGHIAPRPVSAFVTAPSVSGLTLLILLRAFSSGSSALTGIETISNGVPLFKRPSQTRARTTLALLGILLGVMFLGTTIDAFRLGIVPSANTTVLQQLAADEFGKGVIFYLLSFVTMAILAIAANSSFAGFPQFAYIMAKDKWMPHMFLSRGDRLVYQNGILFLSLFAILLVIIFGGSTDRLIPIYAIGVYLGFTIAQLGVARKHLREKSGNTAAIVVASIGACLTALVVAVAAVSKFTEGAWVVVLLIPLLVLGFLRVHKHYKAIATELHLDVSRRPERKSVTVVVPIASVNCMTTEALSYAMSISKQVIAVNVAHSAEERKLIEEKWAALDPDPHLELVVLESPYRSIVQPLIRYVDDLHQKVGGKRLLMVLIPEFVVGKFWQHFLHNQMSWVLRNALTARKDIVVSMLPYHLSGK